MKREWTPGDVALVCGIGHEEPERAVRRGGVWMFLDREGYCLDDYASDARPLVVIDPEDRDDAERLIVAMDRAWGRRPLTRDDMPDARRRMQAALRSLVEPPRPEEPTGLGAVVEAICGCDDEPNRFINDPLSTRFEGRPLASDRTWKSSCGHHSWSTLSAVRVLSEGVQP